MVVFSFQSIISIQCTVVLANSIIYSAVYGLFMGYFLYHLVLEQTNCCRSGN